MATAARLKAALVEALEDEYKARATYRKVIETFGRVRPFVNILASEQRHIDALAGLFDRHALAMPPDRAKASAPKSLLEACRTGVAAEIENGAMYDRLIEMAEGHPDVQRVFRRLQEASQARHLPAFERCAEREANGGGAGPRGSGRSGRGPRAARGGGGGRGGCGSGAGGARSGDGGGGCSGGGGSARRARRGGGRGHGHGRGGD